MAKLHYIFASMAAGKSASLLQAAHNYTSQSMDVALVTAALDNRFGVGKITSRIGLSAEAELFRSGVSLFDTVLKPAADRGVVCIFVDEAQFLDRAHVEDLARCVDELGLPVLAYGLKTNYKGELFEGSAALLALADEIRELRAVCHCGKKATMVARIDSAGRAVLDGPEVQIGGSDTYESLCRKHWMEAQAEARSAVAAE